MNGTQASTLDLTETGRRWHMERLHEWSLGQSNNYRRVAAVPDQLSESRKRRTAR